MILLDIIFFISKTAIVKLYNSAIENFKKYGSKRILINLENFNQYYKKKVYGKISFFFNIYTLFPQFVCF